MTEAHVSDEQHLKAILEQAIETADADAEATVIVRQADGTYIDLLSGEQASSWEELAY